MNPITNKYLPFYQLKVERPQTFYEWLSSCFGIKTAQKVVTIDTRYYAQECKAKGINKRIFFAKLFKDFKKEEKIPTSGSAYWSEIFNGKFIWGSREQDLLQEAKTDIDHLKKVVPNNPKNLQEVDEIRAPIADTLNKWKINEEEFFDDVYNSWHVKNNKKKIGISKAALSGLKNSIQGINAQARPLWKVKNIQQTQLVQLNQIHEDIEKILQLDDKEIEPQDILYFYCKAQEVFDEILAQESSFELSFQKFENSRSKIIR